jgi:hypothetical protein
MFFPHCGQAGLVPPSFLLAPSVNCLLHVMHKKRCLPVLLLPYLYIAPEAQAGHLISVVVTFGDLTVSTTHIHARKIANECYGFVTVG